jgi:hypothetical protein
VEQVDREISFLRQLVPNVRLSYAFGGLKDLEQRIVDFTVRDGGGRCQRARKERGGRKGRVR